jgi:hypothetical protein
MVGGQEILSPWVPITLANHGYWQIIPVAVQTTQQALPYVGIIYIHLVTTYFPTYLSTYRNFFFLDRLLW